MRYRTLDSNGDYSFGNGKANFLRDSPECVAQAVVTRLRLLTNEWFLDLTEGTPYDPAVLGKHTKESYDFCIQSRILKTEGVVEILEYESIYDGESRTVTPIVHIDTIYGEAHVSTPINTIL